jgi:hypothetical protein
MMHPAGNPGASSTRRLSILAWGPADHVGLPDQRISAAMCAITTASGCSGACRLLGSAGDLAAESEHMPNLRY